MADFAFPFQDPGLPISDRVDDLVNRLEPAEKIAQLRHGSPAVERLNIPAYNWWNECLHGVARAGVATVFPQAIGLAASFNRNLFTRVFHTVATEARAKHHAAARMGDHRIYRGLTYWSPNINIFRDPRWGRGQETYGECPWLTAHLAKAMIRALQESQGNHVKIVATPKHFAVHSGPEEGRHSFNAEVSGKDLHETYLPAFRAAIVEAGAMSVMTAYNRTNGEACSASRKLLVDILRKRWRFRGFVVSDCGAVADIHTGHGLADSMAEAAAMALREGCDLNCGGAYKHLTEALEEGLITEEDVNRSLERVLTARFRLGMFDPPDRVSFASIPLSVVDSPEHRQLSLEAARQSIILLRNQGDFLPLPDSLRTLAVIGPNANSREVLLGNYHGIPSESVTALEGIRGRVSENTRVLYQPGCDITAIDHRLNAPDRYFAEAVLAAEEADVAILILGLGPQLEGEEGTHYLAGKSGDREDIMLPDIQRELLARILETGTPVVVVVMSGGAVSLGGQLDGVTSLVQQFYPGQEGGRALAEVLFGDYSPAGRLPVTVYKSVDELPPFGDYNMEGRTYRFFRGVPEFPFGFGLSYARFSYRELHLEPRELEVGGDLLVSVEVSNTSEIPGDEVVQVYLEHLEKEEHSPPVRQLAATRRVHLLPGETRRVDFTIESRQLAIVEESGRTAVHPGRIRLYIGGSQPDPVSLSLGAPEGVSGVVDLVGERMQLGD
ncbi:MAG: glycoside hydrolase family 3 C-terminal domain-containing protein [Candidatus Sumerlaeia bacterium]|nr:glycoside hydrolase family 3 C-terminal domain-containing protein [Candidatus Sumerlaeia bacterium]